MTVYACLAFLATGLAILVWGNYSDRRSKATHFGLAFTFVALAVILMIVSAIRSLWFYPLS
jgi:Na+/melibiose symporter-like transporter